MRKLVLGLAMLVMVATGCKKNSDCPQDNTVAPASEEAELVAYLNANGIVATKHKSNMYYQVIAPGTGGNPTTCSTVTVTYNGTLTNGTSFGSESNVAYRLDGLISGWIQGIPLVQKGGKIKLFIPPSLGYGNRVAGAIPANSILIFDIDLLNF